MDGIGAYSNTKTEALNTSMGGRNVPQSNGNGSLTISDFYKLLSAQLRYQDADKPMDTSEMMAQMVQTQMTEAITQMSSMSVTTYGASMMGKEVIVAEVDANGRYIGESKGVVTGVLLGNNPEIYIGNKQYYLSQIMVVGAKPEKEDPEKPEINPPIEPPIEPEA